MYIYSALVTNVVDGDTIDATVDLGFHMQATLRFRLLGIDTPELRSSDILERVEAKSAKDYVIETCLNKKVYIQSYKGDKYGRWLAIVILEDGTTLNSLLLENGFAKVY